MVVPWICPKCGREVGVQNEGAPAELCAACEEAQLAEAHVILVRRYEPAVTLLQEIGALVELAYSETDYATNPSVAHDFMLTVKVMLGVHVDRGTVLGMNERPEKVMQHAQELWDGVHHRKGTIRI